MKTWKHPQAITTTVDMATVVMAMVITAMVIVMAMDMDMAIITMEDTITMAMVATAATMGDMDTMVVMAMEVTTRTIEYSVNHYCQLCSAATMSTVILTFSTCPKYISTFPNIMPDHTLLKRPEKFSFLGQFFYLLLPFSQSLQIKMFVLAASCCVVVPCLFVCICIFCICLYMLLPFARISMYVLVAYCGGGQGSALSLCHMSAGYIRPQPTRRASVLPNSGGENTLGG